MPRLCPVGCEPSDITMHCFPNPDKDPERFKAWVYAIGGKLESASDYECYKKKRICDIHFKDQYHNRCNRLNSMAVPSLYLSDITMHCFPNPDKYPERFKAWVHAIGGKLESASDYECYKKKRICDIHFKDQYHTRFNRLNSMAVPSLYLSENYNPHAQEHCYTRKQVHVDHNYCKVGHLSSDIPHHQFPHPIRCPDIFIKWVELVGGKLECPEDYEFFWKRNLLCDRHFTDKDRNRNNRLSASAVPSLHLPVYTPLSEHNYCEKQDGKLSSNVDKTTLAEIPSENKENSAQPNDPTTGSDSEQPLNNQLYSHLDNLCTEQLQTFRHCPYTLKGTKKTNQLLEEPYPVLLGEVNGDEYFDNVNVESKDENMDEPSEPVEEGPFSWQQPSAVVPCDTDILEEENHKVEDTLWDVEQKNCKETTTTDTATTKDEPASEYGDTDSHAGYCCNVCEGSIRGFRFMCVQCADYDLCAKCESKALHSHHYMLRVPPNKDKEEIAEVMQRIRRAINDCIIVVNDNGEVVVKEENEEIEDPVPVDFTTELTPESNVENTLDATTEGAMDTDFNEVLDPNIENSLDGSSVVYLENNIHEDVIPNVENPLDASSVGHILVNNIDGVENHLDTSSVIYLDNNIHEDLDPNVENPLTDSSHKYLDTNIERNVELHVEIPWDVTIKDSAKQKQDGAVSDIIKSPICAKCNASFDGSTPFHYFQKQADTSVLCLKSWANYCWPDKDWSTVESLKNIPANSYLCAKHFEEYIYSIHTRKGILKQPVRVQANENIKVFSVPPSQIASSVQEMPSTSLVVQESSAQTHLHQLQIVRSPNLPLSTVDFTICVEQPNNQPT